MRQIDRRTFLRGPPSRRRVPPPSAGRSTGSPRWLANAMPRSPRSRPRSTPSTTCVTARSGCGSRRVCVPLVPRHRVRRSSSTTAPISLAVMTAWARSPVRRERPARPQPRGQRPGPGRSARRGGPYDPMARQRHDHDRGHPARRGRHAYTSLNGTQMNCSGGVMPWGSWITCEETVNGPDVGPDFTGVSNVPLTKPHGFIFEVPAGGQSNRQPITTAGRFAHEAVAFDPRDGILYLTEDNFGFPSGFYRYIPRPIRWRTGRFDNEGQLQMLAVIGQPNVNLEPRQQPDRATYDVEWVDIDDPAPSLPVHARPAGPHDQRRRDQLRREPGSRAGRRDFSRLEGSVYDHGVVYFCSTQGGGAAETAPDRRRRLRQRHRPDLGLRHRARSRSSSLPVARPRRPRLPGQRDRRARAGR